MRPALIAGHPRQFRDNDVEFAVVETDPDDLVAADIVDFLDTDRQALAARRAEPQIFRPDTEFHLGACRKVRIASRQDNLVQVEQCPVAFQAAGGDIHARRTDEVADEGMFRPFEQRLRGADLDDLPLVHDDDLVGEG